MAVYSELPAFEPSNVTLAAPVAGPFTATASLLEALSNDTPATRDTMVSSTVAARVRDAPTPEGSLHRIEVDDPHADDTAPLPPTEA
jgi:hypothetical protein